ncbi:MAG: MFS transporter [Chitinophagaceae bacterium]|nr:MFS transporter [Chitinophagaceae bacterium]
MNEKIDQGKSIIQPHRQADSKPVRRILVFIIVSFALLMMTIDLTIVATALHTLQHELHTTINWAGWTITAYSFGFVLMLPITGELSERYGHKRMYLISITVFTSASLLCGLSNSIYQLVAMRVIQAAGAAGITPSVTGIIVNHFGSARDRAVSLFGSVFPIGAMIGPIFGGLFVTYLTWRDIFFVNIPIGIVVIILSIAYIPKDPERDGKKHPRLDIPGILFMGSGILSAMFAASYLGEKKANILSAPFLILIVFSAFALFLFFRHINRTNTPIIAPRLIHGKGFGSVNIINVVYGGVSQGVVALVPLYAANRYGLSALDSGTLLVAQGVAAVILSTVVTIILRKSGYRPPLYAGVITMAIGIALLVIPPPEVFSSYTWLAIATFLIGAGAGAINPSCRNAGLQLAPEHASTLAALRSMCLQIGSILTVAISTAILTGSSHPGNVQAWIYLASSLLFLIAIPLIKRIPEHHGTW